MIVLNKWDATQLTLNVPEQMDGVSAMVLSGESVGDTAPEYRSLFAGCEAVTGGSYTGGIPGESVVVYKMCIRDRYTPIKTHGRLYSSW